MKGFNRTYFEKKGIDAFRLLARCSGSDAWPITFHCDEGYYLLIYNDGCDITLTSPTLKYTLSTGEMLLISPVMYNDPTFFPKENAEIYAAIFCIPYNFCNMTEDQIKSLRIRLNNCMLTKAPGIPILRDMMIYAIDRAKGHLSELDETIFNSIGAVLIETINMNMAYTAISCADWQAYGARYCLHYLENNSAQDILLALRHDICYPDGVKMFSCIDTILIDLEGNIVYKISPDIRDYRTRLPAGFRGFALMSLYGSWMTLDIHENRVVSPPPLNKMMRIAYYPYYFSNGEIVAGLPADCSFSIGAITLVNILSSDEKRITFKPVKSLSWAAGKAGPIETMYLSGEHMTCIVHYNLFLEYGMTVAFRGNLIRCSQQTDGTPVVSSNMGCDARLLTEYPADIQRVVNYMRENPSTAHTIENLARIAMLSPSRFKHKFKEYVGLTPGHYAENICLEKACQMLCENSTLTYIALKLGYTNSSHFSTAFSRQYGMSPSKYRKLYGGNTDKKALPPTKP